MLTHSQIWAAIDGLAAKHGMSASGLAKAAGLDPTTFNKSKRTTSEGRERWPSTESVAKVLLATGENLDNFVTLVAENRPPRAGVTIPLIGFAQAGLGGFFDDGGHPVGSGWDEVELPEIEKGGVYALEVSGESMLPLYRDGDIIIVSTTEAPRRGDRVVVRTTEGEVMAKVLKRETAKTIELQSLNTEHQDRLLERSAVAFVHRIIWARQ
jgi:phage repressor protein C with HTH and peptisase S24 domain